APAAAPISQLLGRGFGQNGSTSTRGTDWAVAADGFAAPPASNRASTSSIRVSAGRTIGRRSMAALSSQRFAGGRFSATGPWGPQLNLEVPDPTSRSGSIQLKTNPCAPSGGADWRMRARRPSTIANLPLTFTET